MSRRTTIVILVTGIILSIAGCGTFAETIWNDGFAGLRDPYTLLAGVLLLGAGLWCVTRTWGRVFPAR